MRPYDWHFGRHVQHESPAARVGRGRLQPALVRQLLRHRQPRHRAADYDDWYRCRAAASAICRTVADTRSRTTTSTPAAQSRAPSELLHVRERLRRCADAGTGMASTSTCTARPRNGLTVQGGTNTGRACATTASRCDTPDEHRQSGRPADTCHVAEKWMTDFRGLATYTVPKIDVLVSGIVRFQTTATGFFTGGDATRDRTARRWPRRIRCRTRWCSRRSVGCRRTDS